MTEEVENLQMTISDLFQSFDITLYDLTNKTNIKHDLEVSFLKTKVGLLEETLNTKIEEIKALENFKENNAQLLELVEK